MVEVSHEIGLDLEAGTLVMGLKQPHKCLKFPHPPPRVASEGDEITVTTSRSAMAIMFDYAIRRIRGAFVNYQHCRTMVWEPWEHLRLAGDVGYQKSESCAKGFP